MLRDAGLVSITGLWDGSAENAVAVARRSTSTPRITLSMRSDGPNLRVGVNGTETTFAGTVGRARLDLTNPFSIGRSLRRDAWRPGGAVRPSGDVRCKRDAQRVRPHEPTHVVGEDVTTAGGSAVKDLDFDDDELTGKILTAMREPVSDPGRDPRLRAHRSPSRRASADRRSSPKRIAWAILVGSARCRRDRHRRRVPARRGPRARPRAARSGDPPARPTRRAREADVERSTMTTPADQKTSAVAAWFRSAHNQIARSSRHHRRRLRARAGIEAGQAGPRARRVRLGDAGRDDPRGARCTAVAVPAGRSRSCRRARRLGSSSSSRSARPRSGAARSSQPASAEALAVETQRCLANERAIVDRPDTTEEQDRADLASERSRCDAARAAIVGGE